MSIWDDTEHPDTAKVRKLEAEIERLDTVIGRQSVEVERLRTALEAIIERAEHRMSSKVIDDVVAIARAALTGGKE